MASARRKGATRRGNDSESRGSSRRSAPRSSVRRPSSSGPPTGLIIAGIFLGLGVLGWAFMSGPKSTGANHILAAEKAFADGMSSTDVNKKLGLAEQDSGLSVEDRNRIAVLRDRLTERDKKTALDLHNNVGTVYAQKKLRNYADKYLSGEVDPAKARVFMERAALFHERWPDHYETDWVERQERRFSAVVDMSKPPTWEDVAWQAEALTYAKPRDYERAFEAIDAYVATCTDDDEKTIARNLKVRMEGEREEYHVDRMLQAEFELKKNKDEGTAIHWLVHGVIGMGDQAMSDEAAEALLKMPSCAAYLRGYRTNQPLVFERLEKNAIVASYIKANDV